MQYVIEQYRWDVDKNYKYYHLINSKTFESDNNLEEKEYNKDGSIFLIYKVENEIQNTRRTNRNKIRNG